MYDSTCLHSWNKKQRKRKRGSPTPPREHTTHDLRTSHKALPPNGSVTSQLHHSGDLVFNTWGLGSIHPNYSNSFSKLSHFGFSFHFWKVHVLLKSRISILRFLIAYHKVTFKMLNIILLNCYLRT
jgi:hypothetical protein